MALRRAPGICPLVNRNAIRAKRSELPLRTALLSEIMESIAGEKFAIGSRNKNRMSETIVTV